MRVLVACEESQAVTIAFRELGHEAYSCDLQDCSGGHPEWHIKYDVIKVLYSHKWDLVIAHPPCTFLTVSNTYIKRGCSKYTVNEAQTLRENAIEFFMVFVNADCERMAIENPIGIMSTKYRKPDQIIQPWMFGDDASKATCLWLKGLPILLPTHSSWKKRYSNQTESGQNNVPPGPDRAKLRSKTFPGIAKAMATQWSEPIHPYTVIGEVFLIDVNETE